MEERKYNIPSEKITAAMLEAGKIMLSAHNIEENKDAVHAKPGTANFVTVFDVKVQNFLISRFSEILPEASFLAEEKDNSDASRCGYCFCIDPIDGTTNFIHDMRASSISVGLLYDGEVVFGAIYDPYNGELFTAEKGKGAYLNSKRISVSAHGMENALIGIGVSPYYKDTLCDRTFDIIKKCFLSCADIRRGGSAAIDLSALACGRLDGFFECILSPWDYAAGSIIIKEAGGMITDFDGNPLDMYKPCPVVAATPAVYVKMKKIIDSTK